MLIDFTNNYMKPILEMRLNKAYFTDRNIVNMLSENITLNCLTVTWQYLFISITFSHQTYDNKGSVPEECYHLNEVVANIQLRFKTFTSCDHRAAKIVK